MTRVVSLDCAGTMLNVRWAPAPFVRACAEGVGLSITESQASLYHSRFVGAQRKFLEVEVQRSDERFRSFWRELTAEWLVDAGLPATALEPLAREAERQLHETSDWYALYPDTLPGLAQLRAGGWRLAVVSNWDRSLFRALESKALGEFEAVLASHVEDVFKPDPTIFLRLAERLGVEPREIVHVGDSLRDDYEGALGAGLPALHLDRGTTTRTFPDRTPWRGTVSALTEVSRAITLCDSKTSTTNSPPN